MNNRRAIAIAGLIPTLIAAVVMFYMVRIAPRWLQVKRLRVGIVGLPVEWRGLRIAHLSDFHLGHPRISEDMLWRARKAAIEFDPDIIALTGDFFDDGKSHDSKGLFGGWPPVPVLAVLGNHDHRGGREHVASLVRDLRSEGVSVLVNEAVSVQLRGRAVWIAGVDDPYSWKDDVERALKCIPLGEEALLLLAHSPTAAEVMPVGSVRLVLSGHTHGGQIRLLPSGKTPFLRLIHRVLGEPRRNEPSIYHGAHWVRGAVVCISNGLGMSQLPMRFRTRPQVLLIELIESPASDIACDDVRRYVEDHTPEPWWATWFS